METKKYIGYGEATLKPFTEKLQLDYYDSIENFCKAAYRQAQKIKSMEKSESQLQYVVQCEDVIAEVEKHIKSRKETFIPYIHELSEKVKDAHDCSNCSGGCKVNHDMYVLELNVTNDGIKRALSKLQMITLPLYSEANFPDQYRLLRSNMALLETSLTELFFLENNYLVPKIQDAQKSINAGGK